MNTPAPVEKRERTLHQFAEFAGRALLALPFVLSGLGKLGAYSATAAYMSSVGIPGVLLPAAIAAEVLGALAIIIAGRPVLSPYSWPVFHY